MRKTFAMLLVLVFLTSLVTLPHVTVKAVSNTIIVPDDYPTITAAIGNATNGDTILVRSGTYEGPINSTIKIDKSVSIIGENNKDTIINLYPAYSVTWILYQPIYGYSDAIIITADSCSLQDLTIQINPGGDIMAGGNKILIEGNQIMTGQTTGVTLEGSNCRVTNNVMDGIILVRGTYNQIDANSVLKVQVEGSFNLIKDNICQGLGLAGLGLAFSTTNNVFLENRVSSPSWGYAGIDWGIDIHKSNGNFLYKNDISGFMYGFRFWFSSNNIIKANTATNSLRASLSFCVSNDNLFSLNNFGYTPFVYDEYSMRNLTLSTNTWSDDNLGNYWSDYQTKYPNATEVDSTGVGNIPYVINDNNTDPYPLMNYDISAASIQLPDWTNLNLPALRPTPTFPSPTPQPTATPLPSPTVSPSPTPLPTEPFPTTLVIASVITVAFVGIGLAVYFKKRKH
jgi:parallel beta-helix repeat protein